MDLNKKISGQMLVRVTTDKDKNVYRVENSYDYSKGPKKGIMKNIDGNGVSCASAAVSDELIKTYGFNNTENKKGK